MLAVGIVSLGNAFVVCHRNFSSHLNRLTVLKFVKCAVAYIHRSTL